jgi:hypothetical protein
MHIFSSIVLTLGAIIVLILGLISVLRDLIERGPYQAPTIDDEELAWPHRIQGTAPSAAIRANSTANSRSFTDTNWPGERESGQT